MKLYRKGEYTAHETFAGSFDITKESQKGMIQLSHVSLRFILDMGFEEVEQDDVPERFGKLMQERAEQGLPEANRPCLSYHIFLKHYPKQDILPVEEIIDKMKERFCQIDCDESGYRHTPRKDYESILRTYAIKDTTPDNQLIPLDIEKIQEEMNKSSWTVLQGYHTGDVVHVDTVIEIISKYGKDTTLVPLDVEKVVEEVEKCTASLHLVNGLIPILDVGNLRLILSKYGTPKITESQIEEYTADFNAQSIIRGFAKDRGYM